MISITNEEYVEKLNPEKHLALFNVRPINTIEGT
jgi:hypothetical protein